MPRMTPEQVAQKWATNATNGVDSMRQGVMAVTVNPAERAAQAQDRYLAGVQRAVSEGRYQAGLRKVTLESWRNAMLTKGVNRIASGVSEAKPKMAAFMQKWLPYMDQLKQTLANTPRGDLETNIQRAVTAMRFNAAFKQ